MKRLFEDGATGQKTDRPAETLRYPNLHLSTGAAMGQIRMLRCQQTRAERQIKFNLSDRRSGQL